MLRRFLIAQLRFDLRPDVVKALGLDIVQQQNMKTKLGFHQAADFALLHRKHRSIERLDHHSAADKTEIAAIRRRARVLRMLPGQFGELARILLRLLQQLFRLGPDLRLVGGTGAGIDRQQDMPCLAFLAGQLGFVLVEVFFHLGFVQRHFLCQILLRQGQIFDPHLLRLLEFSLMRVVVLLGSIGRQLYLCPVLFRHQRGNGDAALLGKQTGETIDCGLRHETGTKSGKRHLLHHQILAHARFEQSRG